MERRSAYRFIWNNNGEVEELRIANKKSSVEDVTRHLQNAYHPNREILFCRGNELSKVRTKRQVNKSIRRNKYLHDATEIVTESNTPGNGVHEIIIRKSK